MVRVLVFGGRTFNDRRAVFEKLDGIHSVTPIGLIIHGACPNRKDSAGTTIWSADMLAEEWAKSREVPYVGWPAKWRTGRLGKGEGHARNEVMHVKTRPTLGCGFPGGPGSADMRSRLERAGIHVV